LLPASPAQAGLDVGDIRLVRSDALNAGGCLNHGQSLGHLDGVMTNDRPVTLSPYLFAFDLEDGLDPGVPTRALGVAAGLTGMQRGTGTWTLHQPQSDEADLTEVQTALAEWAHNHQEALQQFAKANSGQSFTLRVITRVVRAEEATLVVRANEPWAGKRWDGYDNEVAQVLDPVASPVDVAYRLDALNLSVAANLRVKGNEPGGVTVVAASSQTMTLVERLEHPMTVGYQVWDVLIGPNGQLDGAEDMDEAEGNDVADEPVTPASPKGQLP